MDFYEQAVERQKEPVHSTSNQREKISRLIFAETMYRFCTSETFNVCFFRFIGRRCDGTAQPQSLSAAALYFIQKFSCDSQMKAYRLFHTERSVVEYIFKLFATFS